MVSRRQADNPPPRPTYTYFDARDADEASEVWVGLVRSYDADASIAIGGNHGVVILRVKPGEKTGQELYHRLKAEIPERGRRPILSVDGGDIVLLFPWRWPLL